MIRSLLVALLLSLPILAHAEATLEASPAAAWTRIDGAAMFQHAQVLAGERTRGRGTAENGIFVAAEYIENLYAQWGIEPLDPIDRYRQWYPVAINRVSAAAHCTLLPVSGEPVEYADTVDFNPFPFGAPEPVEGPLAFVGYGISAPELGYDDYAGFDATGKIVFVLRKAPNKELDRFGEHATFVKKAKTAKAHGAIGMVLVSGPNTEDDPAPLDTPAGDLFLEAPFAAVFLHTQYADAVLAGIGQTTLELQQAIDASGKPLSRDAPNRIRLHVPTEFAPAKPSINVIGYLPGSDPKLAQEIIVIGAHLDHLGARGDIVYPGADDNASGSATLIEVAHVLATGPRPKRSLLFIHFSGEEMGLLGSKYYVANPFLPEGGRIVAMLNMDMTGRGDGGVRVLVPKHGGAERLRGRVEPIRQRFLGAVLAPDKLSWGDASGNSDHAPFADAGIPALFLVTSGEHPDYHRRTDTPDKLQPECMAAAGQLCVALVTDLAQNGVPR